MANEIEEDSVDWPTDEYKDYSASQTSGKCFENLDGSNQMSFNKSLVYSNSSGHMESIELGH